MPENTFHFCTKAATAGTNPNQDVHGLVHSSTNPNFHRLTMQIQTNSNQFKPNFFPFPISASRPRGNSESKAGRTKLRGSISPAAPYRNP